MLFEPALVLGLAWCALALAQGRFVALPLLLAGFSALRLFLAPVSPYVGESDAWIAALDSASAQAFGALCLTVFVMQRFRLVHWELFFKLAALLGTLALPFWVHGILLTSSMSGCFCMAVAPLFFHRRNTSWCAVLIPLSAIFLAYHESRSQPLLLLFVITTCGLYFKRKRFQICMLVAVFLIARQLLIPSHTLFDSHGRLGIWTDAFYFWLDKGNFWLGFGLGSFSVIGPKFIQGTELFTWLHSDWLQILFEQGVLGLSSILLLYAVALYKARNCPQLFTALVAYGVWGIANMPLRFPLAALYGAFLIRSALTEPSERAS